MKKATLMLAVLAAIGCGDDSGSSIVKSVLDAEDDSTQFYCECFYDSEGYASEAACLTDNLYTNVEKSCIADAYGPVVDFNPSLARCLARVSRDAASC
ncbi:MAG: hypothetical protein H6724_18625, partial [Sandaracinus sp.]|nr:hypothetical protein [Sandaracinus sp.]